MNLLVLDTSAARCAAFVRTQNGDTEKSVNLTKGHDRHLAALTRKTLRAAVIAPAELERIAVITGPGTFTGIRIGVAFARGLALALGIKAVGINALDVFAAMAADNGPGAGVCDIRRGEVAWCIHDQNQMFGSINTGAPQEAQQALEAAAQKTGADIRLAGTGVCLLRPGARLTLLEQAQIDMGMAAHMAGQACPKDHPPAPWYARPADAKLPGGLDP